MKAIARSWLVLTVLFAAPGWAAAQSRFSGIVVFGTSLSDPGNAFALVGDQSTPPDFMLNPLLIPSAPYARGGHHFSNGATWVEQFARSVGLGHSVRAAGATSRDVLSPTRSAQALFQGGYNDGVNPASAGGRFLQRSGGMTCCPMPRMSSRWAAMTSESAMPSDLRTGGAATQYPARIGRRRTSNIYAAGAERENFSSGRLQNVA